MTVIFRNKYLHFFFFHFLQSFHLRKKWRILIFLGSALIIIWLVYKMSILHISNEIGNLLLFLCLLVSVSLSGMSLVQLLPKSLCWWMTFVLLFSPKPPNTLTLIIDFRAKKYWHTIRTGERRGQSFFVCGLKMLKKPSQPHNFGNRNVMEVGNVYISFLDEMKKMRSSLGFSQSSHFWRCCIRCQG